MIRALVAGIIIAATAPLIGTFLVTKRYALIADTLSHVSLAGVAIGLLLQVYPVYTALIVSIIAAILIEKLSQDKRISGESTLALFLSGGLALATVLISLARGFTVDLFSYLFGSITTVTESDIILMAGIGILTILIVALYYKDLLYISFDVESAKVSGLPVKRLNYLFMILTATTIAVSIRVVGVLLVSALMVIPVLTASLLAKSFKQTLIISVIAGEIFVVIGLILSYYQNLAAGGTIVLFALICFGIISILKR
jgi:zinc transport system permease protein